jgi:ABC-type amino acid transport substrate-binding protein
MRRRVRAALALAAALALTGAAAAPPFPDALPASAQAIKATGAVRVGFRGHAVPFSYLGPGGTPVGYSIDLCREVVATLSEDLGRELAIRFVEVTPEDRIAKVEGGAIDLECGATTNTVERSQRVGFSPVIFVTGTRLAVPTGSGIRGVADLKGRRVAVVAGATAAAVMRDFDRLLALELSVVPVAGYGEALAAVSEGRADAIAADDVLLRGAVTEARRGAGFAIVGELLSFEPYGIAYARDDPVMAGAVRRTFERLAQSREIEWTYDRWFVRPLPSGQRIDMPMSPQLRRAFELVGLPTD